MSGHVVYVIALLQRGAAHHQARRLAEAERSYREALRHDPGNPEALCLLGMIAGETGRLPQAAEFFRRALKRAPDRADIYHNLGETYRHLGEFQEAIKALHRAIELKPDLFDAYRSAADAAREAAERAARAGQEKIARETRSVAAQYLGGLGYELLGRGMLDRAGEAFREALALDAQRAPLHTGYGRILFDTGRPCEAEACFRRAIAREPYMAESYVLLASALAEQGRAAEAIAAYQEASAIAPEYALSRDKLTSFRLMWPLYGEAGAAEAFERHRCWGAEAMSALSRSMSTLPFANSPIVDRRLRVGFISPDLRHHSVTYFFESLLASLDTAAFETFCYAEVKRPDAVTERLKGLAGQWRSTVDMSDEALRERVRDDEIDILIDLAGHTNDNRLTAFSIKPAPVTVTWLGYPATTGLPTMDWRITDALADPPGSEHFYVERLWRLPDGFLCYRPAAEAPDVAALPALSAGRVTFGSFNNLAKMSDDAVALWARVLEAVPGSRLLLKAKTLADATIRERCLARFAAHGVAAERIELRPLARGVEAHLATYGEVDVALDPFPYNGATTTCEALWMGVPVVTLVGSAHAGRVGLSLLTQVGLDHLAAGDADSYVAAAASLATDLDALARLRRDLRPRMAASPLCDAPRFARDFEAALREMWRGWCEGGS